MSCTFIKFILFKCEDLQMKLDAQNLSSFIDIELIKISTSLSFANTVGVL